jgi:hypothetical protein
MDLFTGEHHVDDALAASKIMLSELEQLNQSGVFNHHHEHLVATEYVDSQLLKGKTTKINIYAVS